MDTLKQAGMEDLDICSEIIDMGREFQEAQGFTQWTKTYPNRETIRQDILEGKGYLLCIEGEPAGYLYLDLDGEPAYKTIQGRWHTKEPYAAVHRIAFHKKYQGRGLAGKAFRLIGEWCLSRGIQGIRIDTAYENLRMQHVLEKNGFQKCGIVHYPAYERLAYDKVL